MAVPVSWDYVASASNRSWMPSPTHTLQSDRKWGDQSNFASSRLWMETAVQLIKLVYVRRRVCHARCMCSSHLMINIHRHQQNELKDAAWKLAAMAFMTCMPMYTCVVLKLWPLWPVQMMASSIAGICKVRTTAKHPVTMVQDPFYTLNQMNVKDPKHTSDLSDMISKNIWLILSIHDDFVISIQIWLWRSRFWEASLTVLLWSVLERSWCRQSLNVGNDLDKEKAADGRPPPQRCAFYEHEEVAISMIHHCTIMIMVDPGSTWSALFLVWLGAHHGQYTVASGALGCSCAVRHIYHGPGADSEDSTFT